MAEDCFHLGIKSLIKNKDGEVLLLKVNTKSLKGYSGKAYWDIPGGRIQVGSTVEETLKREAKEETGITSIKNFYPLAMVLSNIRIPLGENDVGLILSVYVCDVDDVSNVELSDEHVKYGWFSPNEASKLLTVKYPKEFTEKIAEM